MYRLRPALALQPRLWIRIRIQIKTKDASKLLITASLFNFLRKFAQAPLFLTFEQRFLFFTIIENCSSVYFLQILLSWTWTWIRIRILKTAGSGSAKMNEMDSDKICIFLLALFLCLYTRGVVFLIY